MDDRGRGPRIARRARRRSTLLDGVALVAGAAIASVHLRGGRPARDLPGAGWALIWLTFAGVALTASGPFLRAIRRLSGRPGTPPRLGDRLWALLGAPWVLAALPKIVGDGDGAADLYGLTLSAGSAWPRRSDPRGRLVPLGDASRPRPADDDEPAAGPTGSASSWRSPGRSSAGSAWSSSEPRDERRRDRPSGRRAPRLIDLLALVVGFGAAAMLMRSLWPAARTPTAAEAVRGRRASTSGSAWRWPARCCCCSTAAAWPTRPGN